MLASTVKFSRYGREPLRNRHNDVRIGFAESSVA
jgi:hypothetical protein